LSLQPQFIVKLQDKITLYTSVDRLFSR